jgi:hypothetical protein
MKSTQHILSLIALLALLSLSVMGQDPETRQQRIEKYKSMKIAYFTDNLDISPDEAEKFWPLFNQYDQQHRELRKKHRKMVTDFSEKFEELSDQEAEEIIELHNKISEEKIQLDIKFQGELKKILPAKKIIKFYITEGEFREYMLRRIREDHGKGNRNRDEPIP